MLITISIIAILAGAMLTASFAAQEAAREQKTKALIAKLDSVIRQKWESYRTRRVPIALENFPLYVNGEPFSDTNMSGIRDSTESFTDVTGNLIYDPPMATFISGKLRLDCAA